MQRRREHQATLSLYQLSKSQASFWSRKTWSHIELGAANYGKNVHGDPTYITKKRLSENQHKILFMTVDELRENKGKRGIIYINDLQEEMVKYTINRLKKYIHQVYPDNEIELKPLIGDFFKINIPKVTSIHLKNPESWFFESLDREDESYKKRLQYFSEQSKEGLTFVTYYTSHFFRRMKNLGVGCKILNANFFPYIHADGTVIRSQGDVVQFSIKSLNNLGGRLRSHSPAVIDNSLFATRKRKREDELVPDTLKRKKNK